MSQAIDVLRALHEGDSGRASELVEGTGATGAPHAALLSALRAHLASSSAGTVYDEPSAFDEFIGNGDNPALYRATIEQLTGLHRQVRPREVLDIGCGDGRVTSPCLTSATEIVDLVEPSVSLLDRAVERIAARSSARVVPHGCGIGAFMAQPAGSGHWMLAQSTFALHSLDPTNRAATLAWAHAHVQVLGIVEFDVPAHPDGSPDHLGHLAERYDRGVAMYRSHPDVIDRFLMPVLVGQLHPERPRLTFEQPVERWCADVAAAGFDVAERQLFEHWWGPAHLIVGRRMP